MVDGCIVQIGDVLTAYSARGVRFVELLFQRTREASGLLDRGCQDRVEGHPPFIEACPHRFL
jgi:hypothetical protein